MVAAATAVSMSGLLGLNVAHAAEVSELKFNTAIVQPAEGRAIPVPNGNLAVTAEGGVTIDNGQERFGGWYEADPLGACAPTNDAQFVSGKQYFYRFAIGKFSLPAGDTLKNDAKVLVNGEEYSLAGCADAGMAPSKTAFVAYGPLTIPRPAVPTPPTPPTPPAPQPPVGGGGTTLPAGGGAGSARQNGAAKLAAQDKLADTGASLSCYWCWCCDDRRWRHWSSVDSPLEQRSQNDISRKHGTYHECYVFIGGWRSLV